MIDSRRRRPAAWALAILATLGFALVPMGAAGAQTDGAVQIVSTDLSDYPTIRLGVAVSGAAAGTDLTAGGLVVTEDDAAVAATVEPVGADSLAVMLAIDISGSMAGEPLLQAKSAAVQFLDQLPDSADVGVLAFDDVAEIVAPLSTDRVATRAAILGLAEDGGGTALYDAVSLAVQATSAAEAERTATIVLTDGADTASTADVTSTDDALEASDSTFYLIELESGDADRATLDRLAAAAEGQVIAAADPAALNAAYVDLGQRIVNQYIVTFESASEGVAATYEVESVATGAVASTRVALPNDPDAEAGPDGEPTATTEVAQLVTESEAGTFAQQWILYAGAALLAVSLVALGSAFLAGASNESVRRPLQTDAQVDADAGPAERIVASVRRSSSALADRFVARSNTRPGIDHALDRAGIVMRSGEFVALVVAVGLALTLVLFLLLGLIGLVFGVAGTVLGAPAVLSFLASRRNARFADQLGDTLLLMAGSLRAGFGVAGTVDSVAQEMDDPMGTELQRAMLEIRLGREIEAALGDVAERHKSEDFSWVVDAMRIHRQVGGDLADILEKVSETIRARTRLRRQVRALTAEGRLSAIVLGLLPFAISLVLYASNPDYLTPLWERTAGQVMLVASVASLAAGIAWLRKLIDMEI